MFAVPPNRLILVSGELREADDAIVEGHIELGTLQVSPGQTVRGLVEAPLPLKVTEYEPELNWPPRGGIVAVLDKDISVVEEVCFVVQYWVDDPHYQEAESVFVLDKALSTRERRREFRYAGQRILNGSRRFAHGPYLMGISNVENCRYRLEQKE